MFHLGGGVGACEDSLSHYKAGFSDRRHNFATCQWIVVPEMYRELCEQRAQINALQGLEPASADYFPAYRCPAVPRPPLKSTPPNLKTPSRASTSHRRTWAKRS